MSSRRTFLKQTAAVGIGAAASIRTARAAPRIESMIPRDETIVRHSTVNGDNWDLTWAADDLQYTSMCDGYGAFERPPGMYNSRLLAIEGGPQDARFLDVPGYPELAQPFEKAPRYYNFGVIAIDGKIYQFLSTWNVPLFGESRGLRFIGVKAIYSPDNGLTWCNLEGSSPVVWENWEDRSRKTMLFFEEPQEAFSMLSVLQMGRGYDANLDGYVYMYSPNGNIEGTMNQLVMLRVLKAQILNRQAYEYFAGVSRNGHAR
jgi:hypothetical protein